MSAWTVEHRLGSAALLHDRPWGETRAVWVNEVTRPAVVLGSTQAASVVDAAAAARLGVDVVRRRSGGGAVLLHPDDGAWVDVILPRRDPLWDDDIGRATHWLGEVWASALADHGLAGTVHRAAVRASRWSALVCFAGLGAGEVTVDGAKVVGISQRRTRAGSRFQCLALTRWRPTDLLDLLRLDPATRTAAAADLAPAARGTAIPSDTLAHALIAHLPT